MFGFIRNAAANGLVADWNKCRRDLEAGLSGDALKSTANELTDTITLFLKKIDCEDITRDEVAKHFQNKRHDDKLVYNYCTNSILWGVFHAWSKARDPIYGRFLEETFQFLGRHADISRINALYAATSDSNAHKS